MQKDKLQEMRDKLKLDMLDDSKKKEIFNKFVEAGGKVVDLNKGRKSHLTHDQKAVEKAALKAEDLQVREMQQQAPALFRSRPVSGGKPAIDLSPEARKENPINKWIERFSAKIGCVLGGIITFGSEDLKNNFKDLILTSYQNSLLNSRMILTSILYQDKIVANDIKQRFLVDTVFPYYYELIYRYDNLYDDDLFKNLAIIRQSSLSVKDLKALLKKLFKAIFILQPYYYSLKVGVEKALIAEKEIRKLDSNVTYDNMKKIYGYIDFVFTKIYPKLYYLIDYYYKFDTQLKSMSFKDYLNISDEDGVGYLTISWKEDLVTETRKLEESKKKIIDSAAAPAAQATMGTAQKPIEIDDNDPLKKGLKIIEKHINFRTILEDYYQKKDPRALFSLKDKVYLAFTLVDFFDKEYSFIINSSKVEYNAVFFDGKKLDMKRDLSDTYYKINNIYERVNEYLKIIREIRKLDNDSYVSMQEKSVRSNQFSLQRSQISRTLRKEAKEFFEDFSKKFVPVISDYHSDKKVVQNSEDILEFDQKVSGERIANGRMVIDVVKDAYYFAACANFLLSDGDLGGFSLMLEKPIYLNINQQENFGG
jgi:hypothetical protein